VECHLGEQASCSHPVTNDLTAPLYHGMLYRGSVTDMSDVSGEGRDCNAVNVCQITNQLQP